MFSQFLQHLSRDDDPHLHIHNLVATVANTIMDAKWRAPDSYGYNEVFSAVSAIVSLHLEAALRRRFGIEWVPRGCQCPHGKCHDPATCRSNFGCEIKGITRDDIECFSTRRQSVNAELRKRAAQFERAHGREPTQRELAQLHEEAYVETRNGKPEGAVDFDALHSKWAESLRARGRELESIAGNVWDESVVRAGGPAPGALSLSRRCSPGGAQGAGPLPGSARDVYPLPGYPRARLRDARLGARPRSRADAPAPGEPGGPGPRR